MPVVVAAGGRCRWSLPVVAMFAKNLDFLLHLRLTSKCKCAILDLPKGGKCKSIYWQAVGRKGDEHEKHYISDK